VQLAETLGNVPLANEIIKGVILPQFVILPLAVVLVWFALSRGIKPLNRLQQRIRQRESSDLSPIAEFDVPDEVAPLVRAINELLARLDQSIGAQKHFLADAAHQLKTLLPPGACRPSWPRDIDAGATDPPLKIRAQMRCPAARGSRGEPAAGAGARRRPRAGAARTPARPGGDRHAHRA
jgi:two-component system sensor histidine kinase TctE